MKLAGSLHIYFVEDESGLLTGRLVERRATPQRFVATGTTADAVQAELAKEIDAAQREDATAMDAFLWQEQLETARVVVEVRPRLIVEKRSVIGREKIPLVLTYAWAALPAERPNQIAGYRVVLPRFGWSFVLEDLGLAAEVLREGVSTLLAGESARWLFEFRAAKSEWFAAFSPKILRKKRQKPVLGDAAYPTLNQIAEDWTELARAGKLGPHRYGSKPEEYLPLLQRDVRPSLLLVGPPGVGKTEWVRELARVAAQERDRRRPARVWATSADRIIAGMSYLGMWEQRCLDLVAELESEGHFLYVENLVPLTRPRTGNSSIADLLLPALQEGELSLVAECTEHDYEHLLGVAPSLVACFEVIRLDPPSLETVTRWIAEYQTRNPESGQFGPDALRRIVQKLAVFRRDRDFPGKAFLFLEWLRQDRRITASGARVQTPRDADRLFARYSGLPEKLVSDDEIGSPPELAQLLARGVVGQDAACLACAEVLTRFKAGISDPEKPIGSLLFVGPTGVGKTELAKQLARFMFGSADRLLRFDMSEYITAASATRLLSDEKGSSSLAQRVSQQPLSLILFDEIEKAHPAVFDLLLGVLGEGRLTTSEGRLVDFRMTLIVLTSNLGTAGEPVGFGRPLASGYGYGESISAVRKHFRPEFFNRLDYVVPFGQLAPDAVRKIVDLELLAAQKREGLARRDVRLRVSADASARLAELGLHPRYGARPLKRAIEEHVMTPLAIELARRPKLANIEIPVELEGDRIALVFPAP